MPTVADLFQYLHAPLKAPEWSWSAQRKADQAVILAVWNQQHHGPDGRRYICVSNLEFMRQGQISPAWAERESLLGLLKAPGLLPPVYMIVCWQDPATLSAQEMTQFDHNFVFSGGELIEHNDRWWLEARSRVRTTQALGPQGGF